MTINNIFGVPQDNWFSSCVATALANGVAVSIMSQAGSGFKWAVTDVTVQNVSTSIDAVLEILGTGNDRILNVSAMRNTGQQASVSLNTPVLSTDNSHLYVRQTGATASCTFTVSGFKVRS